MANLEFDLLIPNQPVDQLPKFHDLGNGKITEFRSFCDSAKSDEYFKKLLQTCPWSHDSIKIAGKTIPIPRLQCWMGDPGAIYAYSGINLTHNAWSPIVLELKTIAENLSSSKLNSVLINRYRNGLDSVSWHADDEKELGDDPVIVSFSFGVPRKFQIKPKDKSDKRRYLFSLDHGSVMIMHGNFQAHWLHQVPKEPKIETERINLTFRYITSVS